MADKASLIIRGGTVVDGTGSDGFIADVAIELPKSVVWRAQALRKSTRAGVW
jgi:N-acyl-D-aspartate/D-glutamate deacylase